MAKDELEEKKFQSDDGYSYTTEEDDNDENEDEDVVTEEDDEDEDTKVESISDLFSGEDLSEEFKGKVQLVFEAAVNEAANEKARKIAESLEEEFEAKLTESVNEAMEGITENLDGYLDYVVKEWMQENEIAIESGFKVEMAESLMNGLKQLVSEHNIDLDEETVDVVADLEEELKTTESRANRAITEAIKLQEEVAALKAARVFDEVSEGLATSQAERLRVLSEKIDHSDLEAYASDLKTLKESFFKAKPTITEQASEEEEGIVLEEDNKKTSTGYSTVDAVLASLDARYKK